MSDSEPDSSAEDDDAAGWVRRLVDACRWAVQVFEGHAGADDLRNRRR